MLAFPAGTARIITILFYNLEVVPHFLGNSGWILPHLLGDLFKRHSIPEASLYDDAFAEG